MNRLAKIALPFAGLLLACGLAVLPGTTGSAQTVRMSFDILAGSAGGSYFSVGEVIARVISHPPGLGRCERLPVCAPPGIIVSARSSEGAVANVTAVNVGTAASGLAQTTVVAQAVEGLGAFRKNGPQKHIRVMAELSAEPVQLLARPAITGLSDLRAKRIGVGDSGGGTDIVATAILAAAGVRAGRLVSESAEKCAGRLRAGTIDACFFLGETPPSAIAELVAQNEAKLLPIDGPMRQRLLARVPGLEADTIAAGNYRGTGAVGTVGVRTLWIANDATPAATVYGIVRALYNPANREMLAQEMRPTPAYRLGEAASAAAVPLHPGAERFYREAGMLPPSRPVR